VGKPIPKLPFRSLQPSNVPKAGIKKIPWPDDKKVRSDFERHLGMIVDRQSDIAADRLVVLRYAVTVLARKMRAVEIRPAIASREFRKRKKARR